jgi:hypothetical protein
MASSSLSLVLLLCLAAAASAQLSTTFYDSSCPKALSTIKDAVTAAVNKENRMGASLLRLHFHDCFVQVSFSRIYVRFCFGFTSLPKWVYIRVNNYYVMFPYRVVTRPFCCPATSRMLSPTSNRFEASRSSTASRRSWRPSASRPSPAPTSSPSQPGTPWLP